MIQTPASLPTITFSWHTTPMQHYSVWPSQPKISTESNVMQESDVVHPNKEPPNPNTEPPVPNALVDSSSSFSNNTATPADPSPSQHTRHIARKILSSQNTLSTPIHFPGMSHTQQTNTSFHLPNVWCMVPATCSDEEKDQLQQQECSSRWPTQTYHRPTTMYTEQEKFHDTSTDCDSELKKYPFPPQHTIITTTLFLLVLATATRTYVTILLPSTQLRIACILRCQHEQFRYLPKPNENQIQIYWTTSWPTYAPTAIQTTPSTTGTINLTYRPQNTLQCNCSRSYRGSPTSTWVPHAIHLTRYNQSCYKCIRNREYQDDFLWQSANTAKNLLRPL